MRDIDRLPIGDTAYTEPSTGGMPPDTDDDDDPETPDVPLFEDPSFTDTKAYTKPSLGGEFGPGGVPVLSGPADGGADALDDEVALMEQPPAVATPPYARAGRSRNASTMRNLYPWLFGLGGGLRMDRDLPMETPTPEPTPEPLPPPFELSGPTLNNSVATFSFSGTASRDATVAIHYVLDAAPFDVMAAVSSGMTSAQIAAAVRTALRANGLLSASGTGGSVVATHMDHDLELTEFTVDIED